MEYKKKLERFDVLDVLRAVLALWVTVGHLGVFPLMGVHPAPGLPHLIDRFLNTTIWGMPAVMAFFVISGFCIHYPLHNGRDFRARSFYLRRYTRILIPAAVAVAIIFATRDDRTWFGHESVFFTGTLWSLLCEEIYYALYPAVRALRNSFGWTPILVTTTAISVVLATVLTPARDWFDMGPLATATILYPVWILGCILAERVTGTRRTITTRQIWMWRAGAWLTMWIGEALNFHTPVSEIHTGILIGAVAYLWIRAEIDYGRAHKARPWLMRAGAWSYSLYLVHPLVFHVFDEYAPNWGSTSRTGWAVEIIVALVMSYAFFLIVERPAHLLAKRIGIRIKTPGVCNTAAPQSPH